MSRTARTDPTAYRVDDGRLQELLTPSLLVFLDHVRSNVDRVIEYVGGEPDRWRPHIKTVKIPRVLETLADRGIRRFKCATTREAVVLLTTMSEHGLDEVDLLVAYTHVGPALVRLGQIASRFEGATLSVLCEDSAIVGDIPEPLGVLVDINPGMNRSGVPLSCLDEMIEIAKRAGERFRGLHFYEGHIKTGEPEERRLQAFAMYDQLMELMRDFEAVGIAIQELITSGTPSFRHALNYEAFSRLGATRHRVSPGTVIYHDARSGDECTELDLWPAALVLSRVVSHPADGVVTLDAGSKAVAAEAGDPCAYALGWPELVAQKPSEEHLPMKVGSKEKPARGELMMLIPRHVCPTVNLAEEAVLIDGEKIVDVVPVAARAHETRMP